MRDGNRWKFGELKKINELGEQVGTDTIEIDEYSIIIKKGGEIPPNNTEE